MHSWPQINNSFGSAISAKVAQQTHIICGIGYLNGRKHVGRWEMGDERWYIWPLKSKIMGIFVENIINIILINNCFSLFCILNVDYMPRKVGLTK